MRLFRKLGGKKKDKAAVDPLRYLPGVAAFGGQNKGQQARGVDWTAALPAPVLAKIFAAVCPHTQDVSYESCELSAEEDACMLCDLRDLSHCVKVCRRWRKNALPVLYQSVRIDAVHYCEREEILAEKRMRRSFLNRNAEPEDTAQTRMRLLCRTLRDDDLGLGNLLLFLKTPYMTRETCKGDLARIAAVAPNLRYADLPEGFFSGDPNCSTLRGEVETRCPDLRKMSYNQGSEKALESIAGGYVWRNLEVLELSHLSIDTTTLRYVLGSLYSLRALKIKDMPGFGDDLFAPGLQLPPVPPLRELLLENTPLVTVRTLQAYLSSPPVAHALHTLSLTTTGVRPADLHIVLAGAPSLQHLSLIEVATAPFPAHLAPPPLSSATLQTLHYEITAEASQNYTAGTAAHYAYLTSSLLSHTLPNLRQLYVRDALFPESLIEFAPPRPMFAADASPPPNPFARGGGGGGGHARNMSSASSNYGSTYGSPPSAVPHFNPQARPRPAPAPRPTAPIGLRRELEVYTKGLEEMEWNFARVAPAAQPGNRGSMTALRPVSSYGLEAAGGRMSGSWGGAAGGVRRSVVVGNGFGGFLAVPVGEEKEGGAGTFSGEWPGIGSGTGNRRESKYDMWR